MRALEPAKLRAPGRVCHHHPQRGAQNLWSSSGVPVQGAG